MVLQDFEAGYSLCGNRGRIGSNWCTLSHGPGSAEVIKNGRLREMAGILVTGFAKTAGAFFDAAEPEEGAEPDVIRTCCLGGSLPTDSSCHHGWATAAPVGAAPSLVGIIEREQTVLGENS